MREIHFTPNFSPGAPVIAELWLNGDVVQFMTPIPNVQNTFVVNESGTYTLTVRRVNQTTCISRTVIEVLFPVVTGQATSVDCATNTYEYLLTLLNPTAAGSDIQYGWSLIQDRGSVTNWQYGTTFTLQADSLPRFFYAKNSTTCTVFVSTTTGEPCIQCNLIVTNVVFSCG
jgi:hypothetical protein